MDEELQRICDEIIPRRTCQKLVDEGITTLKALVQVKERLHRGEFGKLRKDDQTSLYEAICFHEQRSDDIESPSQFSQEVHNKFREEREVKKEAEIALIQNYIKTVLGSEYSEENKCLHDAMKNDDECYNEMVNQCVEKCLTPVLKDRCGNFESSNFIKKIIENFHVLANGEVDGQKKKTFIVAGKTQSGKSSVKGLVQSVCGLLKIPLIVLTKGVAESKDLHMKLKQFAEGTLVDPRFIVCCSPTKGVGRNEKKREIQTAMEGNAHGGTVVLADTHYQIKRVIDAIEKYQKGGRDRKFIIVVDECDTFFRTKNKDQQMEKAFQCLLNMKPSLTIMISATPIPLVLDIVSEGVGSGELTFFNVEPISDYIGLDQFQPLKVDDNEIYLEQNELSLNSAIKFGDKEIPYANDSVKAFYDDALSMSEQSKGVLLLDCSCPRVYAHSNVFQKAALVQEMYRQEGKSIVVITYTGKGLKMKLPNCRWESKENFLISDLIEDIDKDKHYGLSMPIFIFGFSKMRRGISYRSSQRVPTHMLVSLGRGHNAMNVVQTMGRATFNGKAILEQNGINHVTMLTTSNDFTMALKTQEFLEEVDRRYKSGERFIDAVTGANKEMPDTANFLRHTFREIGALKGQRGEFKDLVLFAEPSEELSAQEEKERGRFWDDKEAQRVLRTIRDLSKEHPHISPDDISDAYQDMYESNLKKTTRNKFLVKLKDMAIICKETKSNSYSHKEAFITVNSVMRLEQFINPKFGMMEGKKYEESNRINNIPAKAICDDDDESVLTEKSSRCSNGPENIMRRNEILEVSLYY
jgi:hypothetical protein